MILLNNRILSNDHFSEEVFRKGLSIYEVIRILNGQPIFLKDNLIRLTNSLKESKINVDVKDLNILEKLKHLIRLNNIHEGNIKYVLHMTSNHLDEYIFQIAHNYPAAQDYENGVPTITYEAVRENPNVKYINEKLRTLTNQLINKHKVYEVLLVDNEGYITEGSRSNVFFIKNDVLYTSPLEYVLPGTSRKRVFDICKDYQIPIIEQRINCNNLSIYESAFLTGTSPLILPINQINELHYSVHSTFLRQLMTYYFTLLDHTR